jgi:polyhydroxybutyrate depolymerase
MKQSNGMAPKQQKYPGLRRGIYLVLVFVLVLAAGLFVVHKIRNRAPVGTTQYTIPSGGTQRTYLLHRPASLPSGKTPLVIMLHGALGSGKQAEADYGWDAKADSAHFVVAYPNGISRTWAASDGCCGPPARDHVDDVSFIKQVVANISGKVPIDPGRIYVTGISNGGALAYRLACDTDIFAAIGPDSTNMLVPCPSPKPISVMHIHGTADPTFPYTGGPGKRSNDGTGKVPADTTGPPIPDLIASWRATDNCSAPVETTAGEVTTSVADCPDGRNVTLVTIAGAGHQWPGGAQQKPLGKMLLKLDPPSTALNATDTLWQFFSEHSKS